MSATFNFGFATDDIDKNASNDHKFAARSEQECPEALKILPPQVHNLKDILSTFPSRISFNTISIPGDNATSINIPRRDLFDIRAQLMAEDGELSCNSIAGLTADDIVPNVYEGGFKTWECSVDLSDFVYAKIDLQDEASMRDLKIVELGAGTALPTIALLQKWVSQKLRYPEATSTLQICVSDYNRSVLELATIPNLYLVVQLFYQQSLENEIEIEPDELENFKKNLMDLHIDISSISGSWTPEFADLIPPIARSSSKGRHETLILASETVYSPASIQTFAQTLLRILTKAKDQGSNARALVAAKRVYFGVGGGSDEFIKLLGETGGQGRIVWEKQGMGVGRVIIEVTIVQ